MYRHRMLDGCNDFAPNMTRLITNRQQSLSVGRQNKFKKTFVNNRIRRFFRTFKRPITKVNALVEWLKQITPV